MQLLSSTNQLMAIGNNANSNIESHLLQLLGSSIIDCPSLPSRPVAKRNNQQTTHTSHYRSRPSQSTGRIFFKAAILMQFF